MKKYLLSSLILSSCLLVSAVARDSDEPFQDPSETNPEESLRRVARLMSKMSKGDFEGEELKQIQEVVQDRLTRTLLTLEDEQKQQSSSSGGGGKSKKKRPNKDPQPQSGKERKTSKHQNSGSEGEGKPGNPELKKDAKGSKKEGEGEGKKKVNDSEKKQEGDVERNKDRWGKLPAKERDDLEVNLKRDVPDDFEDDMKDFLKRVKEIK